MKGQLPTRCSVGMLWESRNTADLVRWAGTSPRSLKSLQTRKLQMESSAPRALSCGHQSRVESSDGHFSHSRTIERQALIGLRYRKHLIAVYHPWFIFFINTMRENAHGETDPR